MKIKHWKLLVCLASMWSSLAFSAAQLDPTLKPENDEEISNVFRDMGVVQRRAMPKGGRFLFSSFGTLDFSDGPYTNYSAHFNPGFAISDFIEVYANIAPLYLVSARSIVDKVGQLKLENGKTASITAERPKYQLGGEILYAPAYGKDSLGISHVIRSDTFFKFGISQIFYDVGKGLRFTGGLGKTYFLGKYVGLRFCVDYGYLQNIIDNEKSFRSMLLTELGLVIYL